MNKNCTPCGNYFSQIKSAHAYNYNGHDVCENCYDEISAVVNKGWKYEDFWKV